MRLLRRWFFHNWGLKLLALVISFLLWATYTAEPMAEVGYMVPLVFRGVPPELEIAGDAPTEVHVRVRGREAALRRLSPADFSITVDLAPISSGRAGSTASEVLVRLTADQVETPIGAQIVRIAPSEVRVHLQRRSERR